MKTYKNPFPVPVVEYTGDPFVMRYNGYFYLYCSAARDRLLYCWKSDDMVNWECLGKVFDEEKYPEIKGGYAPEVIYSGGKFFLCTSPNGNGHFLMMADKPEGPYERITGRFGQRIDGSFFLDDNGEWYFLRAEGGGIRIHDVSPVEGGAKVNLAGKRIVESDLNGWTEGPMILKRHGRYFLTYTGNHLLSLGYRVAYSVSETSPVNGYVNMPNRCMLISVDPEFHGLGHSSSCVGPDMDGAYIIYHSYELLEQPRVRRINVDRLFFNGARMYANTIWWEQQNPIEAAYSVRGREALDEKDGDFLTKAVTPKVYTAEVCINPEKSAEVLYSCGKGRIKISEDGFSVYEDGKLKFTTALPKNTSVEALLCVRISRSAKGRMMLSINNNQELGTWQSELSAEGTIGACGGGEIGYVGFSAYAEGSSDKVAAKGVPGRFDAVHSLEDNPLSECKENSMSVYAVKAKSGTVMTYPVNVKKDGEYSVSMTLNGYKGMARVKLSQNGREYILEGEYGEPDADGFCKVQLGKVSLDGGISTLTVEALGEFLIDSFEILALDGGAKSMTLVENSENVGFAKILGWKGQGSMITKEFGYTCSESNGYAYTESYDYENFVIDTDIIIDDEPSGGVEVIFRARNESFFNSQPAQGCTAYAVSLDRRALRLNYWNYGLTRIKEVPVEYSGRTKLRVSIEVVKNSVKVYLDGELKLEYNMARANTSGKIGVNCRGESAGIEEMKVTLL